MYKSGLSLRQVSHVLLFIGTFMGINFRTPSYGTVRIWVQKMGLYLLEKGGKKGQLGQKIKEQWCLIVDESYTLGKSHLLLVLGVRLSSLKFGRVLSHTDVVPLAIESRETWKGEEIAAVIGGVSKKIDGDIVYGVSDKGASIVNAFELQGIPRIADWSHYIANVLEKCYVENTDFKVFNAKMGAFKKKRKQSQYTHYSPPNLSVKMRFMNYIPFLEWAHTMLNNFKKIPLAIAPELQFLQDLKPLIDEMTDLCFTAHKIGVILKKEGINPKTQAEAFALLKILEVKMTQVDKMGHKIYPNPLKVATFILAIKQYFDLAMIIYHKIVPGASLDPQKEHLAPLFQSLIASSDTIESIFGKLKHRCPKDPKRGFSALILIIPLFCCPFSAYDTFIALSKVAMNDLFKWKEKKLANQQYIH